MLSKAIVRVSGMLGFRDISHWLYSHPCSPLSVQRIRKIRHLFWLQYRGCQSGACGPNPVHCQLWGVKLHQNIAHPLIYLLIYGCFWAIQWPSGVVATETSWPTQPKCTYSIEEVCWPLFQFIQEPDRFQKSPRGVLFLLTLLTSASL